MAPARSTQRIEDVQRRLAAARESARILEDQRTVWEDAYEDARLRSLMAETPQADHDLAEVTRSRDVAQRELDRLRREIAEMVGERDRLLRDWTPS
jgi:chromosome segregation ATPase